MGLLRGDEAQEIDTEEEEEEKKDLSFPKIAEEIIDSAGLISLVLSLMLLLLR